VAASKSIARKLQMSFESEFEIYSSRCISFSVSVLLSSTKIQTERTNAVQTERIPVTVQCHPKSLVFILMKAHMRFFY